MGDGRKNRLLSIVKPRICDGDDGYDDDDDDDDDLGDRKGADRKGRNAKWVMLMMMMVMRWAALTLSFFGALNWRMKRSVRPSRTQKDNQPRQRLSPSSPSERPLHFGDGLAETVQTRPWLHHSRESSVSKTRSLLGCSPSPSSHQLPSSSCHHQPPWSSSTHQ